MSDNLNLIGIGLAVASVIFPAIAIMLSKKGKRTSFLTVLSFMCLTGFLIVGMYRISELAAANNWTALIKDLSIRSKGSVGLAVLVTIVNIIPFVTYKTPADAKAEKEIEKAYKERKKQEAEEKAAMEKQMMEAKAENENTSEQK